MPDIYLLIDGQNQGPYTEEQVRQSVAGGHLHGDVQAWHEGLAEWVPVEGVLTGENVHVSEVTATQESSSEGMIRKEHVQASAEEPTNPPPVSTETSKGQLPFGHVSVSREGKKIGVCKEGDIPLLLEQGQLLSSDSYWKDGMNEWLPISRLTGSSQPPPPVLIPFPPAPSSPLSGHATATLVLTILGLVFFFFIGVWAFIPAAIEFYLAKRAIKKFGYSGRVLLTISGWLVMGLFLLIVGLSCILALSFRVGKNSSAHQQTSGADAQPSPSADAPSSDTDDWNAKSPDSMLSYVTSRVQKEGVGMGTVTNASYSIAGTDGSDGVFIGEITFTVHADADSTGLPSGFTGSTTQEFHAFFSYEVEKHRWSSIRMTDSNNSPLDSDSVLNTIAGYFPEPYQIATHSH